MSAATDELVATLEALGLETRVDGGDVWVAVPSERRGTLAVRIAVAERNVTFRAFVMRAPDVHREDVYRRLLRRNDDAGVWSFTLDELGDVFLVAHRPNGVLGADGLDGLLGALSVLVDETFEGLVRTGFAVPTDVSIGPAPAPSDQI